MWAFDFFGPVAPLEKGPNQKRYKPIMELLCNYCVTV